MWDRTHDFFAQYEYPYIYTQHNKKIRRPGGIVCLALAHGAHEDRVGSHLWHIHDKQHDTHNAIRARAHTHTSYLLKKHAMDSWSVLKHITVAYMLSHTHAHKQTNRHILANTSTHTRKAQQRCIGVYSHTRTKKEPRLDIHARHNNGSLAHAQPHTQDVTRTALACTHTEKKHQHIHAS